MSEPWIPRRGQGGRSDWRDFLTAEERAAIVRAEIAQTEARAALAAATAIINPIRMRALQRRLYDERSKERGHA